MANTQQDRFKDILKEYWGYPDFRGIQREIIESISQGKDTLGLMPTGGGKSITFQVPAIAMEGVCIVVTPLIALMKDQVEHLRHKGVKAYAIYSSMQRAEILKIIARKTVNRAISHQTETHEGELHHRGRSPLHQPMGI